jgi:glycosyltransferase involved in cell wall biosynthesis
VAAATRGVPCVYTPHAWPFLDGVPAAARQAYLRVEQAAGRLPATVINVCRYEQAYALARGVGVPRRHFTVHNGVPDVGRELRADPGASPPRMLVVARFEPQKDHATLLSALRAMPRRDWSLELVGDGPLRAAYERDVVAAGLGERVRFVGEVDDVEARMAASQVVVLASRWEGLPLVLLEAMRAGLPVVATDVGGVAEAVVDGITGLLVPRGDARRLAGAMAGLVRSPGRRARMGAAARQRYEDAFTLDAMVEETLRVYRTTLARRDMGSLLHAVPGLADDPAGAATASRPTTQELTP